MPTNVRLSLVGENGDEPLDLNQALRLLKRFTRDALKIASRRYSKPSESARLKHFRAIRAQRKRASKAAARQAEGWR